MYGDYVKERLGDEILETSSGFATYRYTDENTVYLIDLYVMRDFRNMGVAADLADRVCEIARVKGCTRMIGSVVPSSRGSADSMRVLLAYGMVPESSGVDYVIFKKGIT